MKITDVDLINILTKNPDFTLHLFLVPAYILLFIGIVKLFRIIRGA